MLTYFYKAHFEGTSRKEMELREVFPLERADVVPAGNQLRVVWGILSDEFREPGISDYDLLRRLLELKQEEKVDGYILDYLKQNPGS